MKGKQTRCQELSPRATCSMLDKDDHTYPCAKLCAAGDCPLGRRSCDA